MSEEINKKLEEITKQLKDLKKLKEVQELKDLIEFAYNVIGGGFEGLIKIVGSGNQCTIELYQGTTYIAQLLISGDTRIGDIKHIISEKREQLLFEAFSKIVNILRWFEDIRVWNILADLEERVRDLERELDP